MLSPPPSVAWLLLRGTALVATLSAALARCDAHGAGASSPFALPPRDQWLYPEAADAFQKLHDGFERGDVTASRLGGGAFRGTFLDAAQWHALRAAFVARDCVRHYAAQNWTRPLPPESCDALLRRACPTPGRVCLFGYGYVLQMELHTAARAAARTSDDWTLLAEEAQGLAWPFVHGAVAEVVRLLVARDGVEPERAAETASAMCETGVAYRDWHCWHAVGHGAGLLALYDDASRALAVCTGRDRACAAGARMEIRQAGIFVRYGLQPGLSFYARDAARDGRAVGVACSPVWGGCVPDHAEGRRIALGAGDEGVLFGDSKMPEPEGRYLALLDAFWTLIDASDESAAARRYMELAYDAKHREVHGWLDRGGIARECGAVPSADDALVCVAARVDGHVYHAYLMTGDDTVARSGVAALVSYGWGSAFPTPSRSDATAWDRVDRICDGLSRAPWRLCAQLNVQGFRKGLTVVRNLAAAA